MPASVNGDDVSDSVILVCTDPYNEMEESESINVDEVTISTADVNSWEFPSILRHRVTKVEASRNRLMEHSSYFRGLLGGNFSDSCHEVLSIQWNQQTFLSLLASMFDCPVNVTSENFLPLLQGALYFGTEMLLWKCQVWLIEVTSVNGVSLMQLDDLISIWKFGSEHLNHYIPELCTSYLAKNFRWAMSCNSFHDIPHALLLSCIEHPGLPAYSEKRLCEALLDWIAANKENCSEGDCIDLLKVKQIRTSLLPVWFVAGKSSHYYFSKYLNESVGSVTLLKQSATSYMNIVGDCDLLNARILLTESTEQVDLSGCPLIKSAVLLLSVLSYPLEPQLRKEIQLYIDHERVGGNSFQMSSGVWPYLTFESVREINISNCPMLHLDAAIECFSRSFPSLRTMKAAYHLSFRTTKLWQLVKKCPLLCDIDLTVDVSPVMPSQVSISSSFPAITPRTPSASSVSNSPPFSPILPCMPGPLPCNITKLTLEGRIDVSDFDLQRISDFCVSIRYLSLKGCTSLTDGGISAVIRKCVKLNSIVACDTMFGQQSILALCSSNTSSDHFGVKQSRKNVMQSICCNLQMLHMGGCKGIDATSFSELMSQAYTLKSLCLREIQDVDDGLFGFSGSSLEMLDVSNTKVSAAALGHVVRRNPCLVCLRARDCRNLLEQPSKTEQGKFSGKEFYFELGKSCKLEEIAVGWGFSCFSLEALEPAVPLLKSIAVGLGASLGDDALKLLPEICPLLESVVLCFQVISDHVIINMLECLRRLKSFSLCHCLGEISSLSVKVSMPNLRKLRLERVAPWMTNADLVNLSRNSAKLMELSLLGCTLLNPESQKIISSGWPGLISIHLEECGEVTREGVASLFDCHALEDIMLRHNGSGIHKSFIGDATSKLPMLRKLSLDICDAKDGNFDIPEFADRCYLSYVKIARCKSRRRAFDLQHVEARWSSVHRETLVLVWDSKQLTRTVVKERI